MQLGTKQRGGQSEDIVKEVEAEGGLIGEAMKARVRPRCSIRDPG